MRIQEFLWGFLRLLDMGMDQLPCGCLRHESECFFRASTCAIIKSAILFYNFRRYGNRLAWQVSATIRYLLKRFPWISRTFLAKVTLQNRLKMTISAATTYGQNYNLLSNLTALRKSAVSTSSTTYERNVRQIGNTKQSLYQSTGCANKKQSPRKNSISPEL